jgi:branched-chain amino acid transport system ATP-binding protein
MPNAPPPILQLDGIAKHFGGLIALSGVSFTVAIGEICGVIGPNGAGKSTLFNVISGAVAPTAGRVLFEGENVAALPMHRRARMGIARTFQLANTFETMTVAENVLVGAEDHARLDLFAATTHCGGFRSAGARARERAAEAMAIAGISDIAHLPASRLTFGQQRLVIAARALASRPKLLLLDEPAAGLNDAETAELAALLRAVRDSGITILVVEHNMSLVMDVADQVVVLDLGKLLARGTPREIQGDRRVIEAYLGVEEEETA